MLCFASLDLRGDHPLHVGPLGYNGSKVPWENFRPAASVAATESDSLTRLIDGFNLFSILKDGMMISEIPYFGTTE